MNKRRYIQLARSFSSAAFLCIGLMIPVQALADKFVGKVLDEEGHPLTGAVVKQVEGDKAVVTDLNGQFELQVKGANVTRVEVSYMGYVTNACILKSGDRQTKVIRMTPDVTALNEVVVTATRTPKTLKEVPVVTRLISQDDLKKVDATNVQDLLTEELPGLEFGYAMTQETSLSMSGFGGNSILFLVDGERLAGETMNNVDYNRLNLDDVGKVEIVKGASSALYGASAVGGVVNLISRENKEPWTLNLNSRYHSENKEWRSGGDFSFNRNRWNSSTSFQYNTSETVKLTSAFDTASKIQNVYGGHNLNLKERLTYHVTDSWKLIARGGYFTRVSERANYDDHYKDYSGGLRSVWDITPSQNLELSYSYDQYDKSRYVGGARTHDHDYSNRQHILHGLYNRTFGKHVLTVGADYMHDYLSTYQFTDGTSQSQYSLDAFAQFDYNPVKWFNVVASVRDDYFSASSSNAVTGRLATLFKLNYWSIRASYAGGFRAPTLKEMYMNFDMAGMQMIYGNPDLKPERSHNYNLSVEHYGEVKGGWLPGSYSVNLSGYYNFYNRRITTADYAGDDEREEGAMYANEDGVKVTGIDVNARYRTRMGLGASVSYNYLHVANRALDSQFSQPRPHSATWRLDYEKSLCSAYQFYVGLSGRYLAQADSNLDTDGAYSLWKFTLQQTVWKGVRVNFVIDNLFAYKPDIYYWNSAPTTGRTWSVGLSIPVHDLFK